MSQQQPLQSQAPVLNMAPNGNSNGDSAVQSQQTQQVANRLVAPVRDGYKENALAQIRNSLRPFEQADQPLRPVSSMSTGSSNNSVYSDVYQNMLSRGYDEVRPLKTLIILYV